MLRRGAMTGGALARPDAVRAEAGGPAAKRVLDVAGAAIGLVLLLPVLAAAALLVASEAGPRAVLFAQRRGGHRGRAFRILKLRTMRVAEDGPAIEPARPGDGRVTPLGRFLRRSSLDELPQLWNVLVGEMSLVGPRPHALAHDRALAAQIPGYAERYRVRPGMTGWAQVNGHRGPAPDLAAMRARVELDLWYARHRSLGLDLVILARTLPLVLTGRGAV